MKIQCFVLAVVLVICTGCAGTKFTRLTDNQVILGKTTEQSVRQQLGKPYQEGVTVMNGKTFKTLTYGRSTVSLKAYSGNPTPLQVQVFQFHEGVLAGQYYVSTKKEDATDFDESRIEKIKKGETKTDEAINLLGPPSGEYAYPSTENPEDKQLVYVYVQTTMGFTKMYAYQKTLKLTYGPDKIISKIEYNQAGNK